MFANLLIYCRPADPLGFWERHRDILCEDYRRSEQAESVSVSMHHRALHFLAERFEQDDLDIVRDFHLPAVRRELVQEDNIPRIIRDENCFDRDALARTLPDRISTLNEKQAQFYNAVLDSVNSSSGKIFALQAPGGTGKTYTLNLILDTVRNQGKIALATALSGIAATLLHNGRTLHSR